MIVPLVKPEPLRKGSGFLYRYGVLEDARVGPHNTPVVIVVVRPALSPQPLSSKGGAWEGKAEAGQWPRRAEA